MDAAFAEWVPIRRAQVHRTHGEVIGVRAAADHAALRPLPELPYLVAEQHLRRVGKDCLISFEASMYSVPARQVRPFQMVQVRAGDGKVAIYVAAGRRRRPAGRPRPRGAAGQLRGRRGALGRAARRPHPRCHRRRRRCSAPAPGQPGAAGTGAGAGALGMLLASHPAANALGGARPLSDYEQAILPGMPPAGG